MPSLMKTATEPFEMGSATGEVWIANGLHSDLPAMYRSRLSQTAALHRQQVSEKYDHLTRVGH